MQKALEALAGSSVDFGEATNKFIARLIEIAYLEGQLKGAELARSIISDELGINI
jgi:hypothetical protein